MYVCAYLQRWCCTDSVQSGLKQGCTGSCEGGGLQGGASGAGPSHKGMQGLQGSHTPLQLCQHVTLCCCLQAMPRQTSLGCIIHTWHKMYQSKLTTPHIMVRSYAVHSASCNEPQQGSVSTLRWPLLALQMQLGQLQQEASHSSCCEYMYATQITALDQYIPYTIPTMPVLQLGLIMELDHANYVCCLNF